MSLIQILVQIHSRHISHSVTYSDSSSDTMRIRSRQGCHSDTHSYFNIKIQYRYAPDKDAIMILIQISTSDTVQICSRQGCHSDTHSDLNFKIKSIYTPNTEAILLFIQITVQIRSRHDGHSVAHSNSSLDTLHTRLPFYHLFKSNFKIQCGYAPDMDSILSLIQISSSDTLQTRMPF